MATIEIGEYENGLALGLDVDAALVSKLIVEANSGGGKSYALRRIAERLVEHVPVIVIDPEGEYASLREVGDFVLVGPGGERPASVKTAGAIMQSLVELRASAVIDLYELPEDERHAWVAAGVQALVDIPKPLWARRYMLLVDEAHLFAPEKGEPESEALPAMKAATTRGRKRGMGVGLFLQRLAALHKAVAAEYKNVMVGPTEVDVDLDRAARSMGILPKDRPAFFANLRELDPGQFWFRGRAFRLGGERLRERTLGKVGPVRSTHPEPGMGSSYEPPPPRAEVLRLLPRLRGTKADAAEAEGRRLEREDPLRAERAEGRVQEVVAEVARLQRELESARERARAAEAMELAARKSRDALKQHLATWRPLVVEAARALADLENRLMVATLPAADEISALAGPDGRVDVEAFVRLANAAARPGVRVVGAAPPGLGAKDHLERMEAREEDRDLAAADPPAAGGDTCATTILRVLAGVQRKHGESAVLPKDALLVWTCFRSGGYFDRQLRAIVKDGLVEALDRGYRISSAGRARLLDLGLGPTELGPRDIFEQWSARLKKLPAAILGVVWRHGHGVTKRELLEQLGHRDGGYFDRQLRSVLKAGLVVRKGPRLVLSENVVRGPREI